MDYGALCAAPRRVFATLANQLGIAPAIPAWLSPDTIQPGEGYHSLNGNPDRFASGPLQIAPRAASWGQIPARERPVIRAVAAALRLAGGHAPPAAPSG